MFEKIDAREGKTNRAPVKVVASEKRVARPGETIVIVETHKASDFRIGAVFCVMETHSDYVTAWGSYQGVFHWEYEVVTRVEGGV